MNKKVYEKAVDNLLSENDKTKGVFPIHSSAFIDLNKEFVHEKTNIYITTESIWEIDGYVVYRQMTAQLAYPLWLIYKGNKKCAELYPNNFLHVFFETKFKELAESRMDIADVKLFTEEVLQKHKNTSKIYALENEVISLKKQIENYKYEREILIDYKDKLKKLESVFIPKYDEEVEE